jgi:hypothetical protein
MGEGTIGLSSKSEPDAMRSIKSKKALLIAGAIVAAMIIAGYALLQQSPAWRFARAYGQLQLDMSQDQVRELFGRSPDYEYRYKSYRVWYVKGYGFFSGNFDKVKLKNGDAVQSFDALPDVYDYAQLVFDADGRLYAYRWIGEAYTVESKDGSVNGTHLSKLRSLP